jgi:small-conductance mechanosensitive channel
MNPKLAQPWIPVGKIEELVQLEPALLIMGLCLGAWLAYKLLLRRASEDRHRNLKALFHNLWLHAIAGAVLFVVYYALARLGGDSGTSARVRVQSYVGLLLLFEGATVFVKVCRILVFEYLFLSHMRVAVPLLLVNLFTLLLSMFLSGWMLTEIFSVRLAPLLATSAIFSLVLGLALQDTLGHLFAGVALQFDKPYEIGDWIEIQNGAQKWVGQVEDISWRATTLIGLSDEFITVPNRVMAAAQVSNFSLKGKPFVRSQLFRVGFQHSPKQVREVLLRAAGACTLTHPGAKPFVIVTETTESWVAYKLIYFVSNYGSQFVIGDEVIRTSLEHLERAGIELASPRLQLQSPRVDNAPCNPVA